MASASERAAADCSTWGSSEVVEEREGARLRWLCQFELRTPENHGLFHSASAKFTAHGSVNSASMEEASSRYLVFRAPSRGQGIGTMMNGLAAVLVLAQKHNRQACVKWAAFELAFDWRLVCPPAESYFAVAAGSTALLDADAVLELWSFGESTPLPTAEELLSGNRSVVVVHGDGGGGLVDSSARPLELPADPRLELSRLLPPPPPARLVVHLRVGDLHEPSRRGLFAAAGIAAAAVDGDDDEPIAMAKRIARVLPADAYVLTDSQPIRDVLCGSAKWACPQWGVLPHSAERSVFAGGGQGSPGAEQRRSERTLATLRTWADWWAIKSATEHVLHTPSAFSESALRFSAAEPCVLRDQRALDVCSARSRSAEEKRVEL